MPDTDLEARLRADLRARGAAAPPPPADLATRVRRRHRHQRRTQLLVTTAAVAVVALSAGVATALPGERTSPPPAAPGTTTEPRPVTSLEDLPTRGSLAGDQAWLDGVRQLDWYPGGETEGYAGLPVPGPGERRVLFAGDTPSGRIALLAGRVHGRLVAVWLTGPVDAPPGGMAAATSPEQVTADQPLALLAPTGDDPAVGTLVVVTLPGWTVEMGLPPVVDAGGAETRERRRLPVEDGIAVTTAPTGAGWWPRLETGEPGRIAVPIQLWTPDAENHQLRPVAPADPRGIAARNDVGWMAELVPAVLGEYGLTAAEASPTLLTAGPGPGHSTVALLGVTFPSGATGAWSLSRTVREGTSVTDAGRTDTGWYRTEHAAAGTALLDRLLAVPVNGSWLVVSGPRAAVTAEVLDGRGTVVGSVALADGAGTGQVAEGGLLPVGDRTVRLLDAGGGVVAEGPLTPAAGQ